jgi:hypothetical protein
MSNAGAGPPWNSGKTIRSEPVLNANAGYLTPNSILAVLHGVPRRMNAQHWKEMIQRKEENHGDKTNNND